MQEFDYIVVGGGPAGCVVASRLSEDHGVQVALVEAGPDRRGVLANCTAAGMVALVPRKNASNYGFATTAQAGPLSKPSREPGPANACASGALASATGWAAGTSTSSLPSAALMLISLPVG